MKRLLALLPILFFTQLAQADAPKFTTKFIALVKEENKITHYEKYWQQDQNIDLPSGLANIWHCQRSKLHLDKHQFSLAIGCLHNAGSFVFTEVQCSELSKDNDLGHFTIHLKGAPQVEFWVGCETRILN